MRSLLCFVVAQGPLWPLGDLGTGWGDVEEYPPMEYDRRNIDVCTRSYTGCG